MSENLVLDKSYKFALHIVHIYRKLTEETTSTSWSKCLLSDGTNVGAYVESAQEAETRTGFAHEISIPLQKAGRTKYWLNLLHDGGYLSDEVYQQTIEECLELKRLLGAILKMTRGS